MTLGRVAFLSSSKSLPEPGSVMIPVLVCDLIVVVLRSWLNYLPQTPACCYEATGV